MKGGLVANLIVSKRVETDPMPSPIAHALAGVALYEGRRDRRRQLALLAVLVVAAGLPDLDFVPGMLVGNADLYHHGPSHSLFAGLLVAVAAGAVVSWWWGGPLGRRIGLAVLVGYTSHVVLDMFCIDTRPPFGVPLFWPLWSGYVASPVELFMDIHRDRDTAAFFGSLLQPHNLRAAAWEAVLMGGVVLAVRWAAGRRHRSAGDDAADRARAATGAAATGASPRAIDRES
jgi:inner membrane protein